MLSINPKTRYPLLFGGILASIYLAFTNRFRLLGDLTEQREILYAEDKESRALGEEAIRQSRNK